MEILNLCETGIFRSDLVDEPAPNKIIDKSKYVRSYVVTSFQPQLIKCEEVSESRWKFNG